MVACGLIAVVFLGGERPEPVPPKPEGPFDAFAGGYPVPPMPGQTLPEFAGVVAGSSTAVTDEQGVLTSDDERKGDQ